MIDSIQIKNYRAFKDLDLHGFKRINVIAGDSGSGKTSFLEAIFVASGSNPEVYMRTRTWRGLNENNLRMLPSRLGYESLFRELFFDFDSSRPATIEFLDSLRGRRGVTIKYKPSAEFRLSLVERDKSPLRMVPLQFIWKVGDKTHEGVIEITGGNLRFGGFEDVYPVWFISPSAPDPVAEHFSELSKRKQQLPIVDAVRKVFPEISALSLENISGQIYRLCFARLFE